MTTKRKKFLLLSLAITMFFAGTIDSHAANWDVRYASTGGGSSGEDREYEHGLNQIETDRNIKTYTCVYDYTYWTNKVITINGYDINGTSLMETSLNIAKENAVSAGTSIKFNIYETKTINWKVTKTEVQVQTEKKMYKYQCKFKEKNQPQVPITPVSNLIEDDGRTLRPLTNVETTATRCGSENIYKNSRSLPSQSDCEAKNPNPTNCDFDYVVAKGLSYTVNAGTSISTDPSYQNKCDEHAAKEAIGKTRGSFYASYNVKMSDSNEVGGSELVEITNDTASNTIKCKDKNGNNIACRPGVTAFQYREGIREDTITATFEYKINKVCMNVKTAKVIYRNTGCNRGEIEVESKTIGGKEHWSYFLPLNAKSNSNIEINMSQSSGGILSAGECNYVMQNNPVTLDRSGNVIEESLTGRIATSYINLINPKTAGTIFKGNYCYKYEGSSAVICNESSSDYAEILRNGCYLTSKIKVPIKQGFYNEVKTIDSVTGGENVTFNGFNFYYKPIDVNNSNQTEIIYPNGIPTDSTTGTPIKSLWSEWYDAQTNPGAYAGSDILDLSESFDSVTYIAQNINAREIREYTESNPYTSWSNMNLDGTSKFISGEGIVIKNPSLTNNIYKLGCGPANTNKYLDSARRVENLLFIKGCET